MSEQGPDYYILNYQVVKNPLKLKWNMKEECEYLPIGRRNSTKLIPRRLKNSQGKTRVFVILASEISNKFFHQPGNKLFLIPWEIDTYFVTFAPITGKQYKLLKSKCDGNNGIDRNSFKQIVENFLSENDTTLLKIFIISHKDNSAGDVVCICHHKFLLPRGVALFNQNFKSLYILPCLQNPSYFELPLHLISIFRSYPWTFHNELKESMMNLFHLTFPGKGLKRSCTHH